MLHNQSITVPKSDTTPNFGRNCDMLLSGEYRVLIFDRDKSGNIESEIALKLSAIVNHRLKTIIIKIKSSSFIGK